MKYLYFFVLINYCYSLVFRSKKINLVDKAGVKPYIDKWIENWKHTPTPLSDVRINEAWKLIIWSSTNKFRSNYYTLTYNHDNYYLLIREDITNKILFLEGILENPENNYYPNQIDKINYYLLKIAKNNNFTLDYSLMKNWSHGYHLYNFTTNEKPDLLY